MNNNTYDIASISSISGIYVPKSVIENCEILIGDFITIGCIHRTVVDYREEVDGYLVYFK